MIPFAARFLIRAHWIAVVNAGSHLRLNPCFEGIRIGKFSSSVGQDYRKSLLEAYRCQFGLYPVKHCLYAERCFVRHQEKKLKFIRPEEKSKDDLFRSFATDNGVHLNGFCCPFRIVPDKFQKVIVGAAGKDPGIFYRIVFFLHTGLVNDLFREVEIFNGQETLIDVIIDCS